MVAGRAGRSSLHDGLQPLKASWKDPRMGKRTRIWVWFTAVVLLLVSLAACTGDDGPEGDDGADKGAGKAAEADTAVLGSFVGEVSGTEAFVAVVAAPAPGGEDSGVEIYLSDGRGLSEWFSGPISDSSFVATSDDGDAETEGQLSADSVTGTVELPSGETVRFEASPPSGGAGLYELTVSSGGELSGASAAGLALKGEVTLGRRGTGVIRMVDGKRLKLALTRKRADDLAHLRAGQARLIVLSDGELRGVAKGRPSRDGRFEFFIRSA
jgi:hypothetical protein